MSDNKTTYNGGVSFYGLLAIVFITLKLCGVITWSWWWVLWPLWGPIVLALGILGIIAGVGIVVTLVSLRTKR